MLCQGDNSSVGWISLHNPPYTKLFETVFSEIQNIVQTPAIKWEAIRNKKYLTKGVLNKLTVLAADFS